jgi:hypothetical protein
MKNPLVLTSLLLVCLAGCATQPKTTRRHGKIIKLAPTTVQAAPPAKATPVAAKPSLAPVDTKPAPTAPAVKPVTPAPVVIPAPVPVPAPAPVAVVKPAPAPVAAVVAPAAKPPAAAPTTENPVVTTRDGAVVQVSWVLPVSDVGYKAVEIMRNDRSDAPGRSRVRAVRASVTTIEDTVPDAETDYWYWIKLTRVDGQVQNLGPVPAPKN